MDDFRNSIPVDQMPLEDFINLPTTVSFITAYGDRLMDFVKEHPGVRIGTILPGGYAVSYINQNDLRRILREFGENFIDSHPIAHTTLDKPSLDATGISFIHQLPDLDLRGRGTIIGFIDTGIDYTSPAFTYEDDTSKILYIWDQTIQGSFPQEMRFGSVYTQEQINQALSSENPYEIVPHVDDDGHGTFLASVAAGRENNNYIGAAPDADIIAVKLKKVHPFFLATTSAPPGNDNIFGSDDIMMGIKFIMDRANELRRPVSICISLGTNFGGHDGFSIMSEYLDNLSSYRGVAICAAAGNESNANHHTDGVLLNTGDTDNIDVRVSADHVNSLSVYIWSEPWDRISVAIQSPMGETIDRIPFETNTQYSKSLTLEKSVVHVGYFRLKSNVAIVSVDAPTQGIWRIIVQGDYIVSGDYHAWLPITGMISPYVNFTKPVPNYTIVHPATATGVMTCGAYDASNNSLYVSSSWGPTRQPRMSPDFVAPGVNVAGVYPTGYGTASGTSIAASIAAGASAILLQWGIVDKNELDMNSNRIRSLLIAGCERDRNETYPNLQWGYGKINLLNTFRILK